MKRKIFLCCSIVIALALAAYGTIAYLTVTDRATNVITTGGVSAAIEEKTADPDSGEELDYPEDSITIVPGQTVSKIVRVVGTNDTSAAWIRAKVTVVNAADDEIPANVVELVLGSSKWTKGADGWYYYEDTIEGSEKTENLITGVTFSGPNMDNAYADSTINVVVLAQGVQAANNGTTVTDAQGWPASNG